jgi:hypothetical protein
LAPAPKDGRKALIYLGLGSAAFCVPASVPIAVTSAAWALGVPMRFGIITALLVTLVIFLVWFISSESLDLLLRHTELDTHLAGRAASHVVSAIILALGYWLVVENGLAALLMAAVVFVLFVCLAPLIDFWYEKPVTNGGARSAD